MPSAPNPVIYRFTNANSGINAANFQPLRIPVGCQMYLLKNAGPDTLFIRSDPNDANTEDTIPANGWEDLSAVSSHYASFQNFRYSAQDILYYAKCIGPLIGKFWTR